MNIKLPYSWIKEYLETDATPEEMQKYLSLCGPSLERIEMINGDPVFDIEITSNRIDMVSVVGIAREAAVILTQAGKKSTLKQLQVKQPSSESNTHELVIEDKDHHVRRILAVVMDIDKPKQSPQWLKDRLEKSEVRSLNNLIDITNYVMLEVGHPTHVFDYDRLKTGKLIFRNAKKGEKYVTLDKKECELQDTDVVIEDGTGRIIDLPGIMGAENSVVTNETKRVVYFIESDDPKVIRRTSMRLALRTMAASINEKNPDPYLAETAFHRGIELFQQLAGAKIVSPVYDIFETKDKPTPITVSQAFIEKRMGIALQPGQINTILTTLGFTVEEKNKEFTVTPPTFRMYDVLIKEDVVEEVARIYGYNNLPNTLPRPVYIKQPKDFENLFKLQNKTKLLLKHLGLHESMNYSMISEDMIKHVQDNASEYLKLSNTISREIEYMRTFLAPSLIKNVKDNAGKKDTLKFFEIAKIYVRKKNELPDEPYHLSIVTNTSYADLKGIIEALFRELNIETAEFEAASIPLLVNGASAAITMAGKKMGIIGQVKLDITQSFGLSMPVFLAEMNFDNLVAHARLLPTYTPINQYARIKLDLTLKASKLSFQQIKKLAHKASTLLTKVEYVSAFNSNISIRFYFESKEKNITENEAKNELDLIQKELS